MKIIGGAGNASTQWIGSKPLNSKKLLLSQPQVLGSQVLKACCGIGKPKRTQTKKMLKIHRTKSKLRWTYLASESGPIHSNRSQSNAVVT